MSDIKLTGEMIDITPTWAGILPAMLVLLADGDHEGRTLARQELLKMAKLADRYVDGLKGQRAAMKKLRSNPKA